ncbi:GNAT family N-acetyltransferase [Budvicia aquatica]|uniref:GNAT family N-acetyltransferase n=1 Tax=Budvicia aquatica TaxID=82979 RepID=UPI00207E6933|nr:GNAT family N-acetyltransferase [Budvicia aquatica]GKX50870.1 N-acetyltransferase [Budvicia aquatica]
MEQTVIRTVSENDVDRCYEIETVSYEGDEAATKEKIAKRSRVYPQGFIVLENENGVAGFINSGCAYDVVMSDEEFKQLVGHDPDAPNVVIMSVVVHPDYQGKGYAGLLMTAFIEHMKGLGKQTIHLMCKERHVGLYEKFGFGYVKQSESDHGGMSWHEMVMVL